MAVTDIILDKPYVLILGGQSSVLGGVPQGVGVGFGQVKNIFSTSDKYEINDYVTYLTVNQIEIVYDNIPYVIITEDKVLNKEVLPP